MKTGLTIKINFPGGIISPGDLFSILMACTKAGIWYVSIGLRQQLLISVSDENSRLLLQELDGLQVIYETSNDGYPNILSSYPAEEIFIQKTWLSEGVYKDILDGIDYKPTLKINISDSKQSFTPMLTGNINWVAAKDAVHFWHLFIRLPKTNAIYEWDQMVYTNDVAKVSKEIEKIIIEKKELFSGKQKITHEDLMGLLHTERYITKPALEPVQLPDFNLPYYEGVNIYNNNKYWIGVYRRDELFSIDFLKDICKLCHETKIGQLCSTPWKSIIVKGIEEKDKAKWSSLLDKHQINVRHAANELNFQVEDDCAEGLVLKNYLVRRLNNMDTRTFGLCIGIKTRNKSEVFSSILVKRKPLLKIFGVGFLYVYDILCAKNYNPNERTGSVFSRNNPLFLVPEQLQRSIIAFYQNSNDKEIAFEKNISVRKDPDKEIVEKYIYQCTDCFTVYDETIGEPEKNIASGTSFSSLPVDYSCPLCDSDKSLFKKINNQALGLQAF